MTGTFAQYAKHNRITVLIALLLIITAVALMIVPGESLALNVSVARMPEMRLLTLAGLVVLAVRLWLDKARGSDATWRLLTHICTSRGWLIALLLLATAIYLYAKITQHYSFHTYAYDLSMYDYALSNTLKGNFMYTPMLGRNFFSEHFAPILFLLLPLYALFDSPTTLLIVQAVAIVMAVVPLYKLAIEVLGSGPLAVVLCIVFLNYDPVIDAAMFDFHMEIFEPLFMFSAFLAIHRKQFGRYTLFALLALSCKEDMPIYFVLVGLYIVIVYKNYWVGFGTIFVCAVWLFVALQIIIPSSFPDGVQQSVFLEQRWGHYGSTAPEIVVTMVRQPWLLFQRNFAANVYRFFGRLGFAGFASPTALLALPILLLNSTVELDIQAGLTVHYSLPYIPFVFVATIYGLRNVRRWLLGWMWRWLLIVYAAITLLFNVGGLPTYTVTAQDHDIRAILGAIPAEASVSAQTSLIPHLPKRERVCTLPRGRDSFDYVIFDLERNRWPLHEKYDGTVNEYQNNPLFKLEARTERLLLFKRQPLSEVGPLQYKAILPVILSDQAPRPCY